MRRFLLAIGVLVLVAWCGGRETRPPADLPLYGDELALSGLRYRKGLELIRTLYEKLLALDHHFSSLRTEHWARSLADPSSYEDLNEWAQNAGPMPVHPQLWAALWLNDRPSAEHLRDEAEKERWFCLLEFCLEVHDDLRLIVYETAFLTRANNRLQESCRQLFEEYTGVIGYSQSLEYCRKADDWESVFLALDRFITSMRRRRDSGSPADEQLVLRDHINLEFAVDRLLNFLDHYQVHIMEGVQYYEKFQLILERLAPGHRCAKALPESWTRLEKEIGQSLESFHQAYEVPELRGSQLKGLLYGFYD